MDIASTILRRTFSELTSDDIKILVHTVRNNVKNDELILSYADSLDRTPNEEDFNLLKTAYTLWQITKQGK